ncbi:MAG: caspase family protein [Lewinella sp.]|nr:caspase family protein [Lewinella sp.]
MLSSLKQIWFLCTLLFSVVPLLGQQMELLLHLPSPDSIEAVDLSPDGQHFLVATGNIAKLYASSGTLLQTFSGHKAKVSDVAFSPDGQLILTGSADGTAILWDSTGNALQEFTNNGGEVITIAFSSDGQSIIAAYKSDFNENEDIMACWDISDGLLTNLTYLPANILSIACSPNDKYVLINCSDHTVRLWNLRINEVTALKRQKAEIRCVTFAQKSNTVAVIAADGSIKLLNLAGRVLQTLPGDDSLSAVAFSSSGNSLLTVSKDTEVTVELWKSWSQESYTLIRQEEAIDQIAVSSSNSYVLTSATHHIALWHLRDTSSAEQQNLLSATVKLSTFSNMQSMSQHREKLRSGDSAKVTPLERSTEGEIVPTDHNSSGSLQPQMVVNKGHNRVAKSGSFSPDGRLIATGSADGTAKLWDLNGRELQTFRGHVLDILDICFFANGLYLFTGGDDETARIWDLYGRQLQVLRGHTKKINAIAVSPNDVLFLTGSEDATAKLWDISGKALVSFIGHKYAVESLAFSPDSKFILTGSRDETAKLWDLSGKLIRTFLTDFSGFGSVTATAFSPNGELLLLLGGAGGETMLFDLSGRKLMSFGWPEGAITEVAFSRDGQLVQSINADGIRKIFDLDGQELLEYPGPDEINAEVLAFSPDGRMMLTGSGDYHFDSTLKLWNASLDGVKDMGWTFTDAEKDDLEVNSVAFAPNKAGIFLMSSNDHTAKVWDLTSLNFHHFKGHKSPVTSACFSPDGTKVLTCSWDGSARIWDVKGKELQRIETGGRFYKAIFAPDAQSILTIGSYKAKLWDLSGKEIQAYKISNDLSYAAAFSPDRASIFTAEWDVDIARWDLAGNKLDTITAHSRLLESIVYSPKGNTILTASSDGTAKLWDQSWQQIQLFSGHERGVSDAIFSPDGNYVFTAGSDGIAKLWDLSGKELFTFLGHQDVINSASFSPDGQFILTASQDETVRLWNATNGEALLTFFFLSGQQDRYVITTPEGYYLNPIKDVDVIHFKAGLSAFGFDQFDLRFNRPDKVLEKLIPFGVDSSLISQYRQAYFKRLSAYGFTEDMLADDFHAPNCIIRNQGDLPILTNEENITVNIEATDSLYLLDRLNVFINDVPIYGIQGINLRDQITQRYTTTLNIPLSKGSNKIQISALNQGGAESLKATTYITYDAPEEKPDLYLITIGTSDYQAEGKDLRYAAKDARDIATLYQNADGFGEVYTKVLTDDQVTKTNILALRSWLEQSQVDDQVLIYVSGHGLIDDNYDFYYATHDIDFANPSEKGILYEEIEGLLDGILARKKLLLMDACHSGEYDADVPQLTAAQQDSLAQKGVSFKGFSKGEGEGSPTLGLQNSFEMMQQLFTDLRRGSGATVITSSAGVQVSFEDEEWRNGAFTYAFLYGLKSMKADANQDGQVTASEIQAFVAEYVPRLTEGLQVPTFRRENLEFDFRVW